MSSLVLQARAMAVSVSLPLDAGFLRRQCPRCERQFKWHHGPAEGRPRNALDPDAYFCPYCGASAALDTWWTIEQLEHVQAVEVGEVSREIGKMFRRLEKETRNSMFTVKGEGRSPAPPTPLHEPPDMVIVQSPCHSWEPIKVYDDWHGPLFCLVCGAPFAT